MNNGAIKDYKFGIKGNWRRTVHNRIVERLPIPPRDAIVLYLAGPKDLDRPEFLRRGFKEHNLIAVEWDKTNAIALRSGGALCLNAAIEEVISNWRKQQVHVVFADFCCGLEMSVPFMLRMVNKNPCFHKAVCVFNMLRGRDHRTNFLRRVLDTKHRGRILAALYQAWHLHDMKILPTLYAASPQGQLSLDSGFDSAYRDLCIKYVQDFIAGGVPQYWEGSYKSNSNQYFDSCAFINVTMEGLNNDACDAASKELINRYLDSFISERERWAVKYACAVGCSDASAKPLLESFHGELESALSHLRATPNATCNLLREKYINRQIVDLSNPVARQIAAIRATRTRRIQGGQNGL